LTKVLVALYEEPDRPKNAIEYIKKHLGGTSSASSNHDLEILKQENEDLKEQIGQMRLEMEKLEEERQIKEQISATDGGFLETQSSM
jgi:hypothetical protein